MFNFPYRQKMLDSVFDTEAELCSLAYGSFSLDIIDKMYLTKYTQEDIDKIKKVRDLLSQSRDILASIKNDR